MITALTEQRLVELRQQGHAQQAGEKFVNPYTINRSMRVLDRRGEVWAASILGRDISARSRAVPSRPWLRDGEPETLVLADRAEDEHALQGTL